ncbi:hypothetical protein BKI52_17025 [marine bacterium AO1-C]|nr:hypothetical protein BKI52_17025 [marine bacterium AO1-C]
MNPKISSFNQSAFLKAAIPSYFGPFIMSGLPGYFLNNPVLMKASYSTIALPSLIATIISFVLLWQFQKQQVLLINRFLLAFMMGMGMSVLALFYVLLFNMQAYKFDIIPSAFIGGAIVALTNRIGKVDNHLKNI